MGVDQYQGIPVQPLTPDRRPSLTLLALVALAACVGWSARAVAALPLARLVSVAPAGGQAGSTVDVTLNGLELDDVNQLHFARAGITAKPKLSAAGAAEPGKFLVAIASDVPPGLYDLRAVGRFGVTNPRTFLVSATPELVAKPGNTSTATATDLPPGTAAHATAEANATQFYRLSLHRGDRLRLEAWTTQLDSKMEAELVLSDSGGRELARSRYGDPLTAVAPAEGQYLIGVHDVLYRGGPEYFYRLSATIGDDATTADRATTAPLRWPFPPASAFVDPPLLALVSPSEAVAATTRPIQPPCEVDARFTTSRPRDVYQFDAPAGSVFWIEVLSHRLGQLAAAPFLLVQRVDKSDKGGEKVTDVQEVYDSPPGGTPEFSTSTRDPAYRLEAKEPATYRLTVRNLVRSSENDAPVWYRLNVRRPSPDFRLVAVPASPLPEPKDSKDVPLWSTLLRRGGTVPITVIASRHDGFAGAIRLELAGLPPGVTAGPAIIASDSTVASVILIARDDVKAWAGPIHIRGLATIGNGEVARDASPAVVATTTYDAQAKLAVVRSRLSDEFMLAVTDAEATPLALTCPAATTRPALVVQSGGKLPITLQLKRAADFTTPITFKLAGHPLLAATKEVTADPKADAVTLELDTSQTKLSPGLYALHVEAQGKLKYVAAPKSAAREVTASFYSPPFLVEVIAAPASPASPAAKK